MTDEEKRIKIAEACGWIKVGNEAQMIGQRPGTSKFSSYAEALPDYLNDLNAMHEAEKVLTPEQGHKYAHKLHEFAAKRFEANMCYSACVSTAAQRAEAFLLTLNLW